MRQILLIAMRDFRRILRVPAALLITIGITFIPALYAWINTLGFWDPYNNTSNISVTVANTDVGAYNTLTGDINIGKSIIQQLKKNNNLGWKFVSKQEALDSVQSGNSYASIIIPKDFSKQISNIVTDKKSNPHVDYYVNQKANGLAAKITDSGVNTLDSTINSSFVATVSQVLSTKVNELLNTTTTSIDEYQTNIAQHLQDTKSKLENSVEKIEELEKDLSNTPTKINKLNQQLQALNRKNDDAAQLLQNASTTLQTAQTTLNNTNQTISNGINNSSTLLTHASNTTSMQAGSILTRANNAQTQVSNVLQDMKDLNAQAQQLLDELQATPVVGSSNIIQNISTQNKTLSDNITQIQSINTDIISLNNQSQSTLQALQKATQNSINSTQQLQNTLSTSAVPQLQNTLGLLSNNTATLSTHISNNSMSIAQAQTLLEQINQSAQSAKQALESTRQGLQNTISTIDTISTDITAINASSSIHKLIGNNESINTDALATFMFSPTSVRTHKLYSVKAYGIGLAPLFLSLSLWVGTFMLMSLVRIEVDDDDIDEELSTSQKYLGRWIFLATIAISQSIVVAIGEIIITKNIAHPGILILTSILSSIVFISIQYGLSSTFMMIGKGICIVLMFIQIPGASGLYPIEMMPSFLRSLRPWLPFTYSINAIRETIAGYYNNYWITNICILLVFAIIAFIIGLLIRPAMANLNYMFTQQLQESDIFTIEEFHTARKEYKLSQLIQLSTNSQKYRTTLEMKAARFKHLYPIMIIGAASLAIIMPFILGITTRFSNDTKIITLGLWVLWLAITTGFLLTIEYIHNNINRAIALGRLSDKNIQSLMLQYSDPLQYFKNRSSRITPAETEEVELENVITPQNQVDTTTNNEGDRNE
ncbi:MAG: YhgE/Pip domain-containing protein [Bifidobacteriaceae bacterium]|nr:YhgE/Pip domain-containing protein [Bifidobacteriaceae bacterium]